MIKQITVDELEREMDSFAALLQDVVDAGASIGFMAPLGSEEAKAYWLDVTESMKAGTKVGWIATAEGQITGCVLLGLELRANGNHRAEVQKLMVHTSHRRQGIARQLMDALFQFAADTNRTLLVLDTRKGDPSERLYQQMGFVEAGVIPRYARSTDGELSDTVFYYREG